MSRHPCAALMYILCLVLTCAPPFSPSPPPPLSPPPLPLPPQAEVLGQSVTWLVPHALAQVLPPDVDYKVMLTFLEFYQTLSQFVNFKLYHMLGVRGGAGAQHAARSTACSTAPGQLTAPCINVYRHLCMYGTHSTAHCHKGLAHTNQCTHFKTLRCWRQRQAAQSAAAAMVVAWVWRK